MQLHEEQQWVVFRSFDDAAAARGMCVWLKNEQVPVRCEGTDVLIAKSFEHRAEWIVDQLPPTDEDLSQIALAVS